MTTEYLLFALCASLALSPFLFVVLVVKRLSGFVSGSVKLEDGGALKEARAEAENLRAMNEVLAPTVKAEDIKEEAKS
jgi:hypothetical protein